MKRFFLLSLSSALLLLSACAEVELASHIVKQSMPDHESRSEGRFKVGSPYKIKGKWYRPQADYNLVETGIASWYGPNFHGKKTANGEIFNMNELTAAHRTLQLPSLVRVTNLENGRSLVVRVNDRGPFSRGRIIDLSRRAAELLQFKNQGTAKVRLEVLGEESRALAEAARRGEDTRGVEVAMNEQARKPRTVQPPALNTSASSAAGQVPAPVPAPVEREVLAKASVPGHAVAGKFYPDPVIKTVPVAPTNIYVQAGSFTQAANANTLARQLSVYGQAKVFPATVNGRQFYRVRILANNVAQADAVLERLANGGYGDAILIVE